jgi:hypothetical protein
MGWLLRYEHLYRTDKGNVRQVLLDTAEDDAYARGPHFLAYKIGVDCFENPSDAMIAAEAMIERKLASLAKWSKRLEKMKRKLVPYVVPPSQQEDGT